MATPIIGDLWDIGKTVAIQLGTWLKDSLNFIFSNFKYDNPFHLFTLAVSLFAIVVIFLGLFGGVGIGITGYSDIGIGSGSVMAGTGSLGDLFTGPSAVSPGGDTDGDGIPDSNDGDIDGDGIPNSEDFDVDGDGTPNADDPTPCGDYIANCILPFPTLCGNNICDNFKTDSGYAYLEYNYAGCSDKNLYDNIPPYCFGDGTLGDIITVFNSTYGDITYYSAVCGTANLQARLSQRCYLYNNSIYYIETEENCPIDCNSTEYECYEDYTCDLNDNCLLKALNCCPPGTYWAGYCTDCSLDYGHCNDPDGECITGAGISLPQLRNVPSHCSCSTDQACISDWGGSTCCLDGTYHDGFCYPSYLCNVTG